MPTPVVIQAGYNNTDGTLLAPLKFGGNYYIPLTTATIGVGNLSMFKSPDGVTWTKVGGDIFVGEVQSVFTACFDGHHSIVCLVEVNTLGGQEILVAFNMTTDSWGIPFGGVAIGSGPTNHQLVARPDGSFVAIDASNFWVWDGIAWTSFPAFTNVPVAFAGGLRLGIRLSVDAAGVVHSVTLIQNFGNTEQAFFYQQFTVGNTLGNFSTLTSVAFPDVNYVIEATNVIINNTKSWVMFAVLDTTQKARVFVGQNLGAPVWGLSLAFVQPGVALSVDFDLGPALANFNDTQFWMVMPQSDDTTFSQFGSTNATNPLLGWAPTNTFVAPQALTIFGSNWAVTTDSSGSGFFNEEIGGGFVPTAFFVPLAPPLPPSGGPAPLITGGPILSLTNGLDSPLGCLAVKPRCKPRYQKGCYSSAIKSLVYRVPIGCK